MKWKRNMDDELRLSIESLTSLLSSLVGRVSSMEAAHMTSMSYMEISMDRLREKLNERIHYAHNKPDWLYEIASALSSERNATNDSVVYVEKGKEHVELAEDGAGTLGERVDTKAQRPAASPRLGEDFYGERF